MSEQTPVQPVPPAQPVIPTRRRITLPTSALAVAVIAVMLVTSAVLAVKQRRADTGVVVLDGKHHVAVEIADTPQLQERGLSGHDPLGADEGMYFIFPARGKYVFWMKDMTFPIDIIWIAGNEIADLTTNVQPPDPDDTAAELPTYGPRVQIDRVLEVPAGYVQEHGLRLGMPVEERWGH